MSFELKVYSKEAEHLLTAVLNGPEYDILELHLAKLQKQRAPGSAGIRIQWAKRTIHVLTYLSLRSQRIYLLSYYLEGKGEPSPFQLAKVARYIEEIQFHESMR